MRHRSSSQPQLTAAVFLRLADLAPALLVGFGLAGGRGVDAGRGDFHRQGDDVDGGVGDRADDAAGRKEPARSRTSSAGQCRGQTLERQRQSDEKKSHIRSLALIACDRPGAALLGCRRPANCARRCRSHKARLARRRAAADGGRNSAPGTMSTRRAAGSARFEPDPFGDRRRDRGEVELRERVAARRRR